MSWYYADNNERRGPVDDAAFDAMVRAGGIRPETLVWREGMANWVPFAEAGYRPATAAPPPMGAAPGAAASAAPGVEMGVCSESGRTLPRSELVEIDGRLVSAEYKHVALQRIREGVSTGAAVDPEELGRQIEERGYELRVGETIGRGWTLIRENFWLCVGATLLTMLVSQAAGMIPIIGPIIVFGPLTGGLYFMMIRMLRREEATIGDAFVGFQRGFGQLLGVTVVLFAVIFACMIPGIVCFIAAAINSAGAARGAGDPSSGSMGISIAAGVLFLAGFPVMAYFWTSWLFALPLVLDKQIDFWPAMKLSRRAVRLHWWRVFGVFALTGLLVGVLVMGAVALVAVVFVGMGAAGTSPEAALGIAVLLGLVCLLGFLAVLPLSYSTVAVAYETIFGERKSA
jgi:hypothetical protein